MIKIKKLNFYLWLLLFLFSIGLLFVSLIVAATRFNNKNKFEELFKIGKNKNSSKGVRLEICDCAI